MLPKDLEMVLTLFNKLKEYESSIAELYRVCGVIWPGDHEFWIIMEQEETAHARHIEGMMQAVSAKPDAFEPGRLFKMSAIQTSISGIRSTIERLKRREMFKRNFLFIARDMEQSIFESKYFDIVKTEDPSFISTREQILSETKNHRERLDRKIREEKS